MRGVWLKGTGNLNESVSSDISTNLLYGRDNASGAWVVSGVMGSGDKIPVVMLVAMPEAEAATEKVGTVDRKAIDAKPVAGDR